MKALKKVFQKTVIPTFSVKGAIGHTMGAAGLIEMLVGGSSLKESIIPATAGLECIDDEAKGWVSKEPKEMHTNVFLSINAGFGGVNTALVVKR